MLSFCPTPKKRLIFVKLYKNIMNFHLLIITSTKRYQASRKPMYLVNGKYLDFVHINLFEIMK